MAFCPGKVFLTRTTTFTRAFPTVFDTGLFLATNEFTSIGNKMKFWALALNVTKWVGVGLVKKHDRWSHVMFQSKFCHRSKFQ